MKPTEQQTLIIEHDENAVVIAAPGSGKTFVMSQKIKRNLKTLDGHQGIIAISYTNKASAELKSRSLSNGENPKASFFGTIDKFNISEIIIPFGKHLFGKPKGEIKVITMNTLSNEQKGDFAWFDRDITLEKLSEDNIKVLKSYFLNGLLMIETIGVLANYVFTNSKACRNYIKARYKYIYIDEYQDSGLQQHEIFLKVKELSVTAVAVGDLNQSIYEFSGKDSKYLDALTKEDSFKYFKLDKNHRCHPSIINYSNHLLDPKTEKIPTSQNLIFLIRVEGAEKEIAKWLDEMVANVQEVFKISKRSQIAILTRKGKTSEIISAELRIPHKHLISTELDVSMNVWSSIFSNLLHYIFDEKYKFIEVIEEYTSYEKLGKNDLKRLLFCKATIEKIMSIKPLDRENLSNEFIKIATLIAPNAINAESVGLLSKVLSSEIEMKSYEPANDDEVNLLTLHKSKGLEYDFIFHLDLHEWVLPNKAPGPNNDFNNPVYSNKKQDLNLHYVGVTRARKGCYLVTSTKRTNSKEQISNAKDSEFLWDNEIAELRYKPEAK